ncbi:MAG: metallophosphoesterase family protein [Pirellulaceae bacterium]|jgi:serine/threonine protein phosphatase 1|nr:metallophosphoesterase family protein [Pirellulaceae bacterium]
MARTLAIGDVHGCFQALVTLANFVSLRPDDTLVMLGDYVDRGPDSRSVLDWLVEYEEVGNLVALRGNHEVMMLHARHSPAARRDWLRYGGDATLKSYWPFEGPGKISDVDERHWSFLETRLLNYYETEDCFFVHANADPNLSLDEQPDYMLYWEPFNDPPRHVSGKTMVCGHSSQSSGEPLSVGHAICIDTAVYKGRWLTCLEPATGECWQANDNGHTRRFMLAETQ